jgi:hypothetical protein
MRIQNGDSWDPGSGMEKSWSRDKHPGSATLDLCLKNEFSEAICMKSILRIRNVYHHGLGFFSLIHELNFSTPDPNFFHLRSKFF